MLIGVVASVASACVARAAADFNAEDFRVDLGALRQVVGVTRLARRLDIRKRRNHALMGGVLVGRLLIPGVADVAEIAESVRFVPACAVVVDRVLPLHFVAVFADDVCEPHCASTDRNPEMTPR